MNIPSWTPGGYTEEIMKTYCRCYWGEIIVLIFIILLSVSCVATPEVTSTLIVSPTPDYQGTRGAREAYAATHFVQSTLTQQATVKTPRPTNTITLTPTITLTIGPSPTPTITLIPTMVPPLVAHMWNPGHVLVKMEHGNGDGGFSAKYPPNIILYADGQLILSQEGSSFEFEPITKMLSESESCALLNTLDQLGFFDYDSATYESGWDGGPMTSIIINAWRFNRSYNMNLPEYIYCEENSYFCDHEFVGAPIILPALRNTYLLLDNYSVAGLQPYVSDSLYVWLMDSSRFTATPLPWPMASLPLAELVRLYNPDEYGYPIELEGEIIPEWERTVQNGVYSEGDLEIAVYSRPSWPMEYISSWDVDIPNPSIPPPDFTLSCSPEDGTLPIPE